MTVGASSKLFREKAAIGLRRRIMDTVAVARFTVRDIANLTGISMSTLHYQVKVLEKLGKVVIEWDKGTRYVRAA